MPTCAARAACCSSAWATPRRPTRSSAARCAWRPTTPRWSTTTRSTCARTAAPTRASSAFSSAAHNALYTHSRGRLHQRRRVPARGQARRRSARRVQPRIADQAEFRGSRVSARRAADVTHGDLTAARSTIDGFLGSFPATPDLLLLGVRVARAQNDRLGAQRYARKLQLDFPDTDQTRALAGLDHNPG